MHPVRLLLNFIIITSVLFVTLIVIAYFILLNNSNTNLERYFNQLYSHNRRMIERIVEENAGTLDTLSGLEQYQDKLRLDLERFRRFNSSEEPLAPEPMDKPAEGEITLMEEGFVGEMPFMIQFISTDGIIISGGEHRPQPEIFRYMDILLEKAEKGHTAGNFIVAADLQEESRGPQSSGVIIFYNQVVHSEDGLLGYLVSELGLDIVTGRNRFMGDLADEEAESDNSGFYSSMLVEQFWVDASGRPLTFLAKGTAYSEKLMSSGYDGEYTGHSLIDPLGGDIAGNAFSNIPVINLLLDEKNESFRKVRTKYRNYNHETVSGGGFWIEELNAGVVIEIDAAAAFKAYWAALGLIILIVALCLAVSIYLILWINRLRMQALDANPLTQLPGNRIINQRIQQLLDNKKAAAVVYGDLDNFKAFNDTYGFSMGDRVIRFTADVVKKVIDSYPAKDAFCGHIGGDDFIFIVPESEVEKASGRVGELFDSGIRTYYDKEHLETGFIEEKNREGKKMKFPIMTFSMAGIRLSDTGIGHYLEVSNRCGELKKLAKKMEGSSLVMERRKDGGK